MPRQLSPGLHFPQHADHFRRGVGGALTRVAMGAADAIFGLLFGVGRQHAKDDRQPFFNSDVLNSPRSFLMTSKTCRDIRA